MLLTKWLNKQTKETQTENTFTPRAKNIVCVQKTVYPNDKPQFSPNGTGEFYGLVELKNEKK